MRLKDKVAIVTGGARGIGGATVKRFADEGAKVVIADVLEEEGTALAGELKEGGYEAVFMPLDVADEKQWEQVVKATEERYGRLDILVNNAGIGAYEPIADTSLETWERIMAVNSTGAFLGTRAAIWSMRANGGGSIINISSIFGLVGSNMEGAYHASKGSVRLLTKAAAVAHAKDGIRVNSVHPGFIDTPKTTVLDESGRKAIVDLHPMGWLGTMEEVANACLFLASDESSFVTGSELVVDGGYTAK